MSINTFLEKQSTINHEKNILKINYLILVLCLQFLFIKPFACQLNPCQRKCDLPSRPIPPGIISCFQNSKCEAGETDPTKYCDPKGRCVCVNGYFGTSCQYSPDLADSICRETELYFRENRAETQVTFAHCGNHGKCIPGKTDLESFLECKCDPGWEDAPDWDLPTNFSILERLWIPDMFGRCRQENPCLSVPYPCNEECGPNKCRCAKIGIRRIIEESPNNNTRYLSVDYDCNCPSPEYYRGLNQATQNPTCFKKLCKDTDGVDTCTESGGSQPVYACKPGYVGPECQTVTDYCVALNYNNTCRENGDNNAYCPSPITDPNAIRCRCSNGYYQDTNRTSTIKTCFKRLCESFPGVLDCKENNGIDPIYTCKPGYAEPQNNCTKIDEYCDALDFDVHCRKNGDTAAFCRRPARTEADLSCGCSAQYYLGVDWDAKPICFKKLCELNIGVEACVESDGNPPIYTCKPGYGTPANQCRTITEYCDALNVDPQCRAQGDTAATCDRPIANQDDIRCKCTQSQGFFGKFCEFRDYCIANNFDAICRQSGDTGAFCPRPILDPNELHCICTTDQGYYGETCQFRDYCIVYNYNTTCRQAGDAGAYCDAPIPNPSNLKCSCDPNGGYSGDTCNIPDYCIVNNHNRKCKEGGDPTAYCPGPIGVEDELTCVCDPESGFGGTLCTIIPPYKAPIDQFWHLFLIKQNWEVTGTVAGILSMAFASGFFFVWKDRKDKQQHAGITIMCEIGENFSHSFYLLKISTGSWFSAGTTANVCLQLFGEKGRSKVYVMKDPKLQVFNRGGIDSFLISCVKELGELTKIKVWHDNTGKSPEWYLRRIIIRDIKTGKRWYFFADCWVAHKDACCATNPQVIRLIPVATEREIHLWRRRFFDRIEDEANNSHLLFSMFFRLPTSNFTRCQRLAIFAAVLTAYMVMDFLYEGVPHDHETLVEIGPVHVSLHGIWLSLQIAVMSLPVEIFLISVFRRIRLRRIPTLVVWQDRVKRGDETLANYNEKQVFLPDEKGEYSKCIIPAPQELDLEERNKKIKFSMPETDIADTEAWILRETKGYGLRPYNMREPDAFIRRYPQSLIKEKDDSAEAAHLLKIGRRAIAESVRRTNPRAFIYSGHGDFEAQFEEEIRQLAAANHPWTNLKKDDIRAIEDEMKKELPKLVPLKIVDKDDNMKDIIYHGVLLELYEIPPVYKKKGYLPWWFIYIAWVFIVIFILACSFFTIFYGLYIGRPRSKEWLSEIMVSFLVSSMIVQPLRILFVSFNLSIVYQKIHAVEEDRFQVIVMDPDKKEEEEKLDFTRKLKYTRFVPVRSLYKAPQDAFEPDDGETYESDDDGKSSKGSIRSDVSRSSSSESSSSSSSGGDADEMLDTLA